MTIPLEAYRPADGLFDGRTILVTGASEGIGRAVARALGQYGARVLLHGRNVRRLESLYDELLEAGAPRPSVCPLDLTTLTADACTELAGQIAGEFGCLDGLLLNAGALGDRAPIEHYDVGTWQRVFQVNVTAPFMLTRALLPVIRKSEDASVLYVSSSVGRKGRAYWGAYAASKAAVENLSETLADELDATDSIRVNTINPKSTRTRMRARAYPGEDPESLRKPEDIVWAFLYLLGPDSRGITGRRFDAVRG